MMTPVDALNSQRLRLPNWVVQALVWAAGAWLLAMTSWYTWTALRVVQQSLARASGHNLKLALAALLALAGLFALVCSHLIWRRGLTTLLWLALAAALGLVIIVLSGQTLAGLLALWLLTLSYLWGQWLLKLLKANASVAWAERLCITPALGLTFLAVVGLLLALAQQLTPLRIWITLLVLTALRHRSLRAGAQTLFKQLSELRARKLAFPEQGLLIVLLAFIALFNLAWALAPETRFDALNYQLAVPRIYLEEQRVVELSYFWHSWFARLFNMVFALALGLHGQIVAKLLVLATGFCTVAGIYALGCRLLDARAGWWAAALFYFTPQVSWLSTTTYVDLPLALFSLASLLAFLVWRATENAGWLWASGLLAGAAIGVKMSAFYSFVVVGVFLLAYLFFNRRFPLPSRAQGVAGYVLGAACIALPWYVITYHFTGNPFFPLLNGIFKSPGWEPVNELPNADIFGVGYAWSALLRVPFALTFETQRFDELLPAGGLGLALMLLPFGLALAGARRKPALLLLAVSLAYFVLWATSFQYGRYYLPMLPVIVALAVAGALSLPFSARLDWLKVAALGLTLLLQGLILPRAFGDFIARGPWRLMAGRETQTAYLARNVLPYQAVQYLNGVVQPGQKVIGVNAEQARFYLRAPLVSAVETRELRQMTAQATAQQMAVDFRQHDYHYLLVNNFDLPNSQLYPYLQPAFLEKYATLEFSENMSQVYRLHPPAAHAQPAQ